jgi:hypothetical protein
MYYTKNVNKRYPKIKYSDIKFKDGDIILFINRTHAMINSVGLISPFTHSGMIVNIEGEPYLTESVFGNYVSLYDKINNFPNRSQINHLRWRLNEYPGELFLLPLREELSDYQIAKLRNLIEIQTEYPNSPKKVLKHLVNKKSAKTSRHCMQHVSWLMDNLDLVTTDSRDCLFMKGFLNSAAIFEDIPNKELKCGNSYGEIHKIIFDEFDNSDDLFNSMTPI